MNIILETQLLVIFLLVLIQYVVNFTNADEVGFHFSNRHFNDILIREMAEMTQKPDHFNEIRVRRSPSDKKADRRTDDTEHNCRAKHKGPFDNCCINNSKDMEKQKKVMALKRQCYRDILGDKHNHDTLNMMSCERVNKAKEDFLCIAQCVGQKLNVIDNRGNIIDSNIIKHVEDDTAPSSWQRLIAKNVTEHCIAETKNGTDLIGSAGANSTNPWKCNPAGIRFSFCLWREFMKSCPKANQSKEPQCAQLMKELSQNVDANDENSNESDDSYEDDE